MRLILAAMASLAASGAMACPTAKDMEWGVQLVDSYGDTETFSTFKTGFVKGQYSDGQGGGAHYLLLGGIYVVQVFDTENNQVLEGTRATYYYPVNPADITPPEPDSRWDVDVLANEQGEIFTQQESHIFGPLSIVTIGGCTYDLIPIISIYRGDEKYEEKLNYLPEFGFAYLKESKSPGTEPDVYEYAEIRAVGAN